MEVVEPEVADADDVPAVALLVAAWADMWVIGGAPAEVL